MNASGKNPPDYRGIALRFIALLPKFTSGNKCVRSLFLGLLFLLATPAQAASTVAGSKLWCASLIGGCIYSSDSAAAHADYDTWNSWYSKDCGGGGYPVRTCILTITGCDGIGNCTGTQSFYAGGTLLETDNIIYGPVPYVTTCPANSTPNGTACTCNTNYVADQTKTSCVSDQSTCPATALTQPPFSDACSTSLEQGKGVDVTGACQKAGIELTKPMQDAEKCIAKKIGALTNPRVSYAGPSATIRTEEYQNHLLEIWNKSVQLNTLMNSLSFTPEYLAEMRQACAQRKAEINTEKNAHSIVYAPSASKGAADHVKLQGIDISMDVADELMEQVTTEVTTVIKVNGVNVTRTTITGDLEDYLHSAPDACDANLHWGGRYTKPDWVHFYLK